MSVRTKEDILKSLQERLGEDTSDETLAFIEDVTDTLNDYETRTKTDGKNWEEEAKRIDADWRKKYRDRFFNAPASSDDSIDEPDEGEEKSYKFEDLFTKE